jgi:pyridoxine 4-dehydrogenase
MSTFVIGGDLAVNRLGYGAMQLTGPGVWGEPADRREAIAVLRRAVELGVTFIDTADAYGPHGNEELIREALFPYPSDLVIATKGGFTRSGPNRWAAVGRPEYLRQCVEMSLRRLGLERIDLYLLHRIDPAVPLDDQIGLLADMQREGKLRHVGLSEVAVDDVEAARKFVDVASVQNRYNLAHRRAEPVVDYCAENDIAFIPWFPIATGELARPGGPLATAARAHHATPAQLAIAWLLHRSPVMIPIPGTSRVDHLEENLGGRQIQLSAAEFGALTAAVPDRAAL